MAMEKPLSFFPLETDCFEASFVYVSSNERRQSIPLNTTGRNTERGTAKGIPDYVRFGFAFSRC